MNEELFCERCFSGTRGAGNEYQANRFFPFVDRVGNFGGFLVMKGLGDLDEVFDFAMTDKIVQLARVTDSQHFAPELVLLENRENHRVFLQGADSSGAVDRRKPQKKARRINR